MKPIQQGQITLPNVIYHYCPLEIFPQIIGSGHLHLTHHSGMNDLTDTRLFFENLKHSAQKKKNPETSERLTKFLRHIEINLKDYFIGCFSEEPDMLSQWHMYGDKGRGVAIGFWTENLGLEAQIPYFSDDPRTNKGIFRVQYTQSAQDELADEIIRLCIEENLEPQNISVDMLTLTQKHISFSQEKEIRIVEVQDLRLELNPDNLALRTPFLGKHFEYKVRANRQIVPYRKHDFRFKPATEFQLHSIWLGPENHTSVEVIQMLLEKNYIHATYGIHRSSTPFAL